MLYNDDFYRGEQLREYALKLLTKLPKDVDCLASSGSSGAAIASAMLCMSERPLIHLYVNREEEKSSHRDNCAGWCGKVIAMVDDLLANGRTLRWISKNCCVKYALVVKDLTSEGQVPEDVEVISLKEST